MRIFMRRAFAGVAGLAIVGSSVALVSTGVAGAATTTTSATAHATVIARKWPVVRPGARGQRVVAIQYLLRAHRFYVSVDGQYGRITTNAVLRFQRSRGLVQDGIAGPATWSSLIVTVRRGDRGDAVRALQHSLRYGYRYRISLDGIFGSQTQAAVIRFQIRFRLKPDGIVGPVTWRYLMANER
jgi:peptidoglycan hydrolase-like protein with peptidoglycan-binding domain